jgi:hypothetical protein
MAEPLDPATLDELVAAMRERGLVLESGGSRCHSSWSWSAKDGFTRLDFDEGHEVVTPLDEAAVRRELGRDPALSRRAMYDATRRALATPFLAEDVDGIRAVVTEVRRWIPDLEDDRLVLALVDPAVAWTDADAAAVRRHIEGFTFYHLVQSAAGWRAERAVGALGQRLLDRALGQLGPPAPAGVERLREAFTRWGR